jgi:hypothetical protein
MQHIGIQLENESGGIIEPSDINFAKVIGWLWEKNNLGPYPWLSGIDPYGYTTINTNQAPFLVKELEILKKEVDDKDVIASIDGTIEILHKVKQHIYLKFIGD